MPRFLRTVPALLLFAAAPAMAEQWPAHILVDLDRGTVLSHEQAGKPWYPASTTKLMTAYVTFRAMKAGELNAESRVVVSQNARKEPPSKMGYKVGTDMTLDNALKMMIVRSANDIAVAIAETVGGSESGFAKLMNAEAQRLGMASTRFYNPNGLPDDRQVTTARDLALLTRALWREFPEHREFFRIPAIKAGRKVLRSHNTLLERYRGANGMKTGFICASGFNMVATATRSGRTLAVVVLGAESADDRAELAASLLNKGFARRASGPALATFRSAKSRQTPLDLHDVVCKKRPKQDSEDLLLAHVLSKSSALGPRVAVMEPVPVTTGVSKTTTSTGTTADVEVPIPRPRPPMPGDSAGLAPFGG